MLPAALPPAALDTLHSLPAAAAPFPPHSAHLLFVSPRPQGSHPLLPPLAAASLPPAASSPSTLPPAPPTRSALAPPKPPPTPETNSSSLATALLPLVPTARKPLPGLPKLFATTLHPPSGDESLAAVAAALPLLTHTGT